MGIRQAIKNIISQSVSQKGLNETRSKEESDLGVTHEFYNPQFGIEIDEYLKQENEIGIHHLSRYHWAKEVLAAFSPKKILDIACGAGYGSFILANHLSQAKVTGADYDNTAIEVASQNYERNNLSYVVGNVVTWEYSDGESTMPLGSYDAITSFDTIEHLLHREIALIRITQNLSENGVYLLSTPCAHNVTLLNPGWEHHKIEYSYIDLQNFLKRFFDTVLVPEDGNLPNIEYWENVINKGKNRYLNKSNPIVCLNPIKH